VGELYADLADDLDLCDRGDPEASYKLAEFISKLVKKAGGPTTLRECGVEATALTDLAELAAKQWTGNFNPRPVDEASLEELYRCAM
jgi:alcohol dehydrogenase